MEKVLTYPCGLKAAVDYLPHVHSVATGIWVKAGSGSESHSENGISHFIEHMMFKGTDKLSAFDIAKSFENRGASVNAFTSKECTCYYFKALDSQTEYCFGVLSDIFFDSAFAADELDRERKVIVEEINMVEDNPEDVCYDLLAKAMFEGHPLSQTVLGPVDNVKRFNGDDVKRYMSDKYTAQNTVLSFAGNITAEKADKLIRKYFLPRLNANRGENTPTEAPYVCGRQIRVDDYEQSNLILAYPSERLSGARIPDQSVLSVLLGASMSSRLFQRVREQLGLAYSVYTSPSAYALNGAFNICLNISPDNATPAFEATVDVLKELMKDGVGDEEFSRAREQIKASLVFGQESVQSVMLVLGKHLLIAGELYDVDRKLEDIDRVTKQGVEDFARELFSRRYALSYVGKKCAFTENFNQ